MSTYQIVNKAHTRATVKVVKVLDRHGNPFETLHAGEPERFEVGTLLDDLTPEELAAFPDRFQLISGEPLAIVSQHGQVAPVPKVNPELFAMLARSYAGQTTADEQALIAFFVEYLAKPNPTADETAAMHAAAQELGLPLYA